MPKNTLTGRAFQQAFFQRMGGAQQFRQLFDHLPEIGFFAKDHECRVVAASPLTLRWAGCEREEDLLGRNDSHMHSPHTVKAIRADDMEVMCSGQPLINRVQMLFSSLPGSGWYCTTKLPILDAGGKVIGLMGMDRPYHGSLSHLPQCARLAPVLQLIERDYAETLSVADLAKLGGCSERQLNRHFQSIFRLSASDFIMHRRIQAAMTALHTDATLAQVGVDCGFYDQSHFTRQFRKLTGETPAMFRSRLGSRHG